MINARRRRWWRAAWSQARSCRYRWAEGSIRRNCRRTRYEEFGFPRVSSVASVKTRRASTTVSDYEPCPFYSAERRQHWIKSSPLEGCGLPSHGLDISCLAPFSRLHSYLSSDLFHPEAAAAQESGRRQG